MLKPLSLADAQRVRDYFIKNNYTEAGLIQLLGTADPPLQQLRNQPRLIELTRASEPLQLLARWFLGTLPVDRDCAAAQIPEWLLDICLSCGLLTLQDAQLVPNVLLVPHQGLLIASDTYAYLNSSVGYDAVLPVNPAACHLANFTLREPVQHTLDLCAGCGIQALLAAPHSESIIATDLNPRATLYSLINARLNDLPHIECVSGDLWQAVQDRTFDLIVCNPPFIIAPSCHYLYRDNDKDLDQLCRQLAQECPRYLRTGGIFQMIGEWVQVKGQPWQQRLEEWFANLGCDVMVLKQYSQEPSRYVLTRLRETVQESAAADASLYRQWLDYFRAHQVETIHGGLIAIRRRRTRPWLRIEEFESNIQQPFGDAVRRRFDNLDFLQTHDDDAALLQSAPKLAPDMQLAQEYRLTDDGWQTCSLRLRSTRGLAKDIGIDGEVAQFMARLDGKHRLGELIRDLSAAVQADPAQVQHDCLRTMRYMLERGLLYLPEQNLDKSG